MKYPITVFILLACSVMVGCGGYGGLYLPPHHHKEKVVTSEKAA